MVDTIMERAFGNFELKKFLTTIKFLGKLMEGRFFHSKWFFRKFHIGNFMY